MVNDVVVTESRINDTMITKRRRVELDDSGESIMWGFKTQKVNTTGKDRGMIYDPRERIT